MEQNELTNMIQNLENWIPYTDIPKHYPHMLFTRSTLKTLFWKRDEHPGLSRCARMIGKRLYVNIPMFGLWLGGQLPEQQVKVEQK